MIHYVTSETKHNACKVAEITHDIEVVEG